MVLESYVIKIFEGFLAGVDRFEISLWLGFNKINFINLVLVHVLQLQIQLWISFTVL